MKILAIADEASSRLWGEGAKYDLADVDLILAAGDLPSSYLSFLTCFTNAPIVYVRGNHDDGYAKRPPEGCLCAEDTVVEVKGVRILGLGGCMRYRPDGENMYSEYEMESRIRRLRVRLKRVRGFDILLAHAPIRGIGDQEDLCHQGFACFASLLDMYKPSLMLHGHVHQSYSAWFQREREYHGIRIVNAWERYLFDMEFPPHDAPTRLGARMLRKASEITG